MLPFGLWSAQKVFTAVIQDIDHYLDNLITMGPPGAPTCGASLQVILEQCAELGVPLVMNKIDGSTPCIVFIGIEIDTRARILRLPDDKLQHVLHTLRQYVGWPQGIRVRRDLESLIGTLQHTCHVVCRGRLFLRPIIDLLQVSKCPHHHVRLNKIELPGRPPVVALLRSPMEWHVYPSISISCHQRNDFRCLGQLGVQGMVTRPGSCACARCKQCTGG